MLENIRKTRQVIEKIGGASRDRTDDLIVANDATLGPPALILQELQAKHPRQTAIYWNMIGT